MESKTPLGWQRKTKEQLKSIQDELGKLSARYLNINVQELRDSISSTVSNKIVYDDLKERVEESLENIAKDQIKNVEAKIKSMEGSIRSLERSMSAPSESSSTKTKTRAASKIC